jgi:hypothetical protein
MIAVTTLISMIHAISSAFAHHGHFPFQSFHISAPPLLSVQTGNFRINTHRYFDCRTDYHTDAKANVNPYSVQHALHSSLTSRCFLNHCAAHNSTF